MKEESSSFNSVYNFIVNFKPEEIDEVIQDFELRSKGIKMLYALDPYDVIAHYLPYTEDSFFRNSNKNSLAQKLICYDYFFDSPGRNVIVLDEYTIELLSVKNRIQKQLKDSSLILKNLDDLKKSTAKFTEMGPDAEEFLDKNFELILLLLILNEKKDFVHRDFDDFLKNKLTILGIKTGSLSNDELIDEIFSTTRHSSLSPVLFKAFVDDNRFELLDIKLPEERYVYLENTFRDIQAIDRTLLINKKLTARSNFVLIYLSSTPNKTNKIFRSLKKISNSEKGKEFQHPYKNIHRNIFQCFLLDILEVEFLQDDENIMIALQSLKKLASRFTSNEKLHGMLEFEHGEHDLSTLNRLRKIFDFYSSKLDNHFYIKIYEKYKNLYQTYQPAGKNRHSLPSKNVTLKSNVNILEIFTVIDNFLNQENFKRKLFDFTNTVSQLQQALDITNILISPNVNFGRDVIKNNFHHLPYLIFYDLPDKPKLINKLYDFLNQLINISNPNHKLIKGLNEYLYPVIHELTDDIKKINLISLQQIVISYINLVTLPTSKVEVSKKEEEIIEGLETQKAIFDSVIIEAGIDHSGASRNLNINFKRNIYSKEVDFILLWLYRRNSRIEDGIDLGKYLVKEFPDDPRFAHGLGLCYISKAYKVIFEPKNPDSLPDWNEVIFDLDLSLNYLKRARDQYETVLTQITDEIISGIVQKNIVAILNSITDISLRKYKLSHIKAYDVITEAREHFESLKEKCTQVKIVYVDSDTFIGTEMELDYFEALEAFTRSRIGEAHIKILHAQGNSLLIDKRKLSNISHPMFHDTQLLVNELFSRINRAIK